MKVYFDNAATTRMNPKVLEAMLPYFTDNFGNPSSIHSVGSSVKVALEESRGILANFINADPSEVYFVSGGSEANNFALFGIAKTEFAESGRNKIISTSAEHHSVLESISELSKTGFHTILSKVGKNGACEIDYLLSKIDDSVSMFSVIHINNETGAINDIELISKNLKSENIFLHSDAVQSFGKISINVKKLGVDAMSASGHKIAGPKGIGMLYVKGGTPISPIIFGGSQERNRRGGTENIAGIIGFAKAVQLADENMDENYTHVASLKNKMIKGILDIDDTGLKINSLINSSPYVLSVTFKNKFYNNDAESMIMYLDLNGIAISNGSACTSGTLKPSHVLLAMGESVENASGTIRFSFSPTNTEEEVEYTLGVLKKMVMKFRR